MRSEDGVIQMGKGFLWNPSPFFLYKSLFALYNTERQERNPHASDPERVLTNLVAFSNPNGYNN